MDASPAPPAEPEPERDREAEMRNVVGDLVDDFEFARLYCNNAVFYNAMNLAAQRLAAAPPSPEPPTPDPDLRGSTVQWISICSAHQTHDASCRLCQHGRWAAAPAPGEAERLLRGLVESLEAAGLTPHMVTDARLPAVRHYNQTRKTAVAWLAARPRPEEADPA